MKNSNIIINTMVSLIALKESSNTMEYFHYGEEMESMLSGTSQHKLSISHLKMLTQDSWKLNLMQKQNLKFFGSIFFAEDWQAVAPLSLSILWILQGPELELIQENNSKIESSKDLKIVWPKLTKCKESKDCIEGLLLQLQVFFATEVFILESMILGRKFSLEVIFY